MEIKNINKNLIKFDPQNPRSTLDEGDVALLQESLEADGQQEPVHLEQLGKNDYMVNEGNKRVAAILKSKKITTVAAIVENKLSPEERLLKQIIIDTHRKNWSMVDRDKAWTRLWKMGSYDANSFAKKLSLTKDMVKSFLDRMELGAEFVEKISNVSAYNITETKGIKDVKTRKNVLKFANKKELTRKTIRQLAKVSTKVSSEVLKDVMDEKITVDDAENLIGMSEEKQSQALETTKTMNQHKKHIQRSMNDGSISVETKPMVQDASKMVIEFQRKWFKLSAEFQTLGAQVAEFSEKDVKKYIGTDMANLLLGCLHEAEHEMIPAIQKIKKELNWVEK